jgi:hypothetical protein
MAQAVLKAASCFFDPTQITHGIQLTVTILLKNPLFLKMGEDA